MVDVDHVGDALDQGGPVAEAVDGGAIEGEEEVEGGRLVDDRVVPGEVGEGPGERAGHHRVHALAHLAKRLGEGQGRPQTVGVGVLVGEAADLARLADEALDLARGVGHILKAALGHGHAGSSPGVASEAASAATVGSSSRSRLLIRTE